MYEKLGKCHPSLSRGLVWCKKCRREQRVDSAECFQTGWPECHGETMTIDHPDTWSAANNLEG